MRDTQLINNLCKFIKLLPEDILAKSIDKIDFRNRSERRKFERIKNLQTKTENLLKETYYRVQLVESIYLAYCNNQFEHESTDYNEILKTINSENYMSKIIYILHLCCNETFDKLYFEKFILSEHFQKALNNEWVIEEKNLNEELMEDKNMIYYVGIIELRNTFFNFKPLYTYNPNTKKIDKISNEELKSTFPLYGSINLAYEMHSESYIFLNDLYSYHNDDNELRWYVVKIESSEIEDNDNYGITKKLDLQKLYNNGEDLSDRIFNISELGIFRIATPREAINNNSFSNMIIIMEKQYAKEELVLLQYDEGDEKKYYGPFELQERSIDGEKYVRPDSVAYKYILKYYNKDDFESVCFEYNYPDEFVHIKHDAHNGDVIPDDVLLKKFTESTNKDILYSDPEEFQRLYSTSPFLADIPAEIRDGRIHRIQNILNNTSDYETRKDEIISSFINRLDNKQLFDMLGDKIKESNTYIDLQKEVEISREKEKSLESEKHEKEKKIIDLENQIKKKNNEIEEIRSQQIKVSTSNEERNIEDLKAEIEALSKTKEGLEKDIKEKEKDIDEKKADFERRVVDCAKKKEELRDIESSMQKLISEKLSKADLNKMLNEAFDPYISNAMIEAAGSYKLDEERKTYEHIANEMTENTNCSYMGRDELINTLVGGIQKFRKYSKNDIINMFICISQNFITIFSGEPGTGKTSICNIIADSLGLNTFGYTNNICKNRYIPVSVERGWSSKRDLIGYYNPLTKKYDRSNSKIYDGLMILNEEKDKSKFPYLILLDEANLSPMEYYWADFMRIADNSYEDALINIGMEKDIYIPETLHFLATINNDQTTEQLSPRLIDRAWIIKLPKVAITESTDNIHSLFEHPILWEDLKKAFVTHESNEMALRTLADQIYDLFDEHNLTVSPRIRMSIKNYVCVAQELMEDEVGICTKKEKSLDFAIIQKLLPKINGYYKDYERLFTSLMQICDENHLKMTNDALKTMQEFGTHGMGYCQYLI